MLVLYPNGNIVLLLFVNVCIEVKKIIRDTLKAFNDSKNKQQ